MMMLMVMMVDSRHYLM